jgi:tetratricopeptide (TPR) repeat protein
MILAVLGWWGMAPAPSIFPRASELAGRARELDSESPEARLAQAWIRFAFSHDVSGALADFDELFRSAPGFALARLGQAYALLSLRRTDEAAAVVQQATELDPLSPIYTYNLAVVAYFARNWAAVEAYGRATLALAPEFAEGHLALGVAAMETAQYDESVSHLQKAISLNATIGQELLAACYCRMGQWEKAEMAVTDLVSLGRQGYVAPHRLAAATAGFPDSNRSLGYLEQGLAERDPRLVWLDAWPVFDQLRAHPRFQTICRSIGLNSGQI